MSNQAGDEEHQGDVTQEGEKGCCDLGGGPGGEGGGERDQQYERVQGQGGDKTVLG